MNRKSKNHRPPAATPRKTVSAAEVRTSAAKRASPAQPDLRTLYRKMYEIRRVEERLGDLFQTAEIRGSLHLCNGQEATVTGACAALRPDDYLTATYRGHGATLAKGTSAKAVIAELLGRETGCCRGRSGSMLLTDLKVGNLGCSGIVAGGIPIAVGAALSAKLSKNQRVAITFFGDGATNQGVFHEALNLAALWKLPCILFCENNLYSEMTPIGKEASVERLAGRGAAYGMRGVVVDGNDVEAVYQATAEAAARARAGEGPTFIEALTYRLAGHMYGDPQNYKPKDEFDAWRRRDPLIVARRKLEERSVKTAAIDRLQQEVDTEIEEAIKLARKAPEPPPEEVDWYVYSNSAGNGNR